MFTKDGEIVKANMERLKAETDGMKSQLHETDDDYEELVAKNKSLMAQVEEAEAKAKEAAGQRFKNLQQMKKPKASGNVFADVESREEEKQETSAEKAQR